MGRWSILSSVDQMEGRTYVVAQPLTETIYAVGYALQSAGRVTLEQTPDGRYVARTINHTPGWAFILPILLLFARKTKVAELMFTPVETGTAVTVFGAIDTRAAMRLREMAVLAPVAS